MSKHGFTLVELLIASALCLLAVVAFSYLLRAVSQSLTTAENYSRAIGEIRGQMEQLRTLPFTQLASHNNQSFANNHGLITVTPVLSDLTKIQLDLNWQPKKLPLHLQTFRSSY